MACKEYTSFAAPLCRHSTGPGPNLFSLGIKDNSVSQMFRDQTWRKKTNHILDADDGLFPNLKGGYTRSACFTVIHCAEHLWCVNFSVCICQYKIKKADTCTQLSYLLVPAQPRREYSVLESGSFQSHSNEKFLYGNTKNYTYHLHTPLVQNLKSS